MKTALVYDRVNKWGGAERVLLTLHEMFPDAPLYTSVHSNESTSWAQAFPKIHTSFLQNLPIARTNHEYFPWLMPRVFESFNFDNYDLVISVTSEAAKGVITRPGTKHICYCLTPTRYLWSGHDDYFKPGIKKTLSKPAVKYLRHWDKAAAHRPDKMLAISTEVQSRIKKYYSRDSQIIHPPISPLSHLVRTPVIPTIEDRLLLHDPGSSFYLLVSRLVTYKKVDIAIRAFNKLGKKLIIIGEGREQRKLRNLANSNVTFVSKLTDDELVDYYVRTKALIFPQVEDFGLVAVEAQSLGTPVIAHRAGGALDTVIEGKTGIFFDQQTPDSLIGTIKKFEKTKFDNITIKKNSRTFSKENFKKRFIKYINKI